MTLRDVLTEQVLERSRWKRRQCGYPELERRRAAWIDRFGQVFVGTTSLTVTDTQTKLIAYDDWPVTDAELARAYLRLVFAGVKGRRLPSPRAPGFGWQAPIVCSPVRHRSLAYVDIVSAYWQLISAFRPDDVILGKEVIPGRAEWLTADEVARTRRLRHCVHGTIFANRIAYYRYGHLVVAPKVNAWSNPTLRSYCMQTLHAVAGRLGRSVGLHAWMTDAAIVDADDAESVTSYLAREWRLTSALKAQGNGAVISATTYMVGDKASRDILSGTTELVRAPEHPYSSLRRVPTKQLKTLRQRASRSGEAIGG